MAEETEPPRGDFSFFKTLDKHVYGSNAEFELGDAYKAVDATPGGWSFLATCQVPANQGFMWWQDAKANEIKGKLYAGHSGASAAMVMREMEAIAKLGWKQWVSLVKLETLQQSFIDGVKTEMENNVGVERGSVTASDK